MVIDAYVASLGATLRGPRAAKRDVLSEVRDSLHDAAAHYESDGLTAADAARTAVAEFGDVATLAPDYQRELALTQGRRTALLVAIAVGVQGVSAEMAWRSAAAGWAWQPGTGYLLLARTVDYAAYLVLAGGLLAALLCGVGSRYLDVGRGFVRATGIAAIAVCAFFVGAGAALSLLSPAWPRAAMPVAPLDLVSAGLGVALPLWMLYSGLRCLRSAAPPAASPSAASGAASPSAISGVAPPSAISGVASPSAASGVASLRDASGRASL